MSARRTLIAVAIVLILGVVAYRYFGSSSTSEKADGAGGRGGGQAVAVVTAVAKTEDMKIRLRSIGWVQPVATVAISARLNSQIAEQRVVEGQTVAKGELLFRLDDREVKAAIARDEANLAKDRAALVRAQNDQKRGADLLARGFLTQQTQDQRVADAKAAAATVAADQAALDADHVQLTYTLIHAPIAGRIGAISSTPGNLVRTGDTTPLVTITQMQPVWVSFTLPERDLAALRAAMAAAGADKPKPVARVSVTGDTKPRASGEVTFLDSAVDQASGTIAVKATMANADLSLWPGQYVNVEIDVGTRTGATVAPTVALQAGQNGSFVYVVDKEGKVDARDVTVAGADGDFSAIATGLKPGERIVVEGQQKLAAGMEVRDKTPGQDGGPRGAKADARVDNATPAAPAGATASRPEVARR